MIDYINKDLTTVDVGVIAHGVNCQGVMGAGVAKAIRNKWPEVYQRYIDLPKGKTMLGTSHFINVKGDDSLWVANCYTQVFYGRGGRFASPDAITTCLDQVSRFAMAMGLRTVYMPKIGCGLGGLTWDVDVKPIVERTSNEYNGIDFYICDTTMEQWK